VTAHQFAISSKDFSQTACSDIRGVTLVEFNVKKVALGKLVHPRTEESQNGKHAATTHFREDQSGGAALMLAVVFGFGAVTTQSAQAQTLRVLYNFAGSSDGGDPYASLIRDAAGNLYSTVDYGGNSFAGAVFKVAPNGTETVLYSFTGGTRWRISLFTVVRDGAGNLYGTTSTGGSSNAGVVFKVDPGGTETVLHSFTGGAEESFPLEVCCGTRRVTYTAPLRRAALPTTECCSR
jgi:uncharacterized repeat protein (TIGR03803 family)